jgi:hypothetical protein
MSRTRIRAIGVLLGLAVASTALAAGPSKRSAEKTQAARHPARGALVIRPAGTVDDLDVAGIVRPVTDAKTWIVTPSVGAPQTFILDMPTDLPVPYAKGDYIHVELHRTHDGGIDRVDATITGKLGQLLLAHSDTANDAVAPGWSYAVGARGEVDRQRQGKDLLLIVTHHGAKLSFEGRLSTTPDMMDWYRIDTVQAAFAVCAGSTIIKSVGPDGTFRVASSRLSIVRIAKTPS